MSGNGSTEAEGGLPAYRARLQAQMRQARSELGHVDRDVQAFIKQRPFVALFGAVVAGFFLARLASRY